MTVSVYITRFSGFDDTLVESVEKVIAPAGMAPAPGTHVLVKPNLVNTSNSRHCCTSRHVIKAACRYLLDCGARVTVADSPAYNPASLVAASYGLAKTLKPLGLKVRTLRHPTKLALSKGNTIGISRDALEAELILNVPKMKVHGQMAYSGAVKNLFGCVVSFRKALAHCSLGHSHELFSSMIMDVYEALPQTVHLLDAIRPMHKDGPINGEPFDLGILAASNNGVGLDTMVCQRLGLTPDDVPLWAEAVKRGYDSADSTTLHYPLRNPEVLHLDGFQLAGYRSLDFSPWRILKGRLKGLYRTIVRH